MAKEHPAHSALWEGRLQNVGIPGYYVSDHDIPEKVLPAPWSLSHMTDKEKAQWKELHSVPPETADAYGGHGVTRVPANVAGAHFPGEGLVPVPGDVAYDYKKGGQDWLGKASVC